jgi:sterol desaturase/sphingolipid hydroxylase (fatty acid hydroxylase superfamily)
MTIDDSLYGARNKRGDWAPSGHAEIAPFWAWPPQFLKVLKWLPGYVWPWNLLHMGTALLWWYVVVPPLDTLKVLSWGWAAYLLVVNWLACLAFYGFFEWRFYLRKAQARRFKYHHKFPSEQPSDVFWFRSQNIDNFLRSFLVSIPLWTLYLAVLVLLAPAIHEVHFFVIHRAIHTPWLYKWVHSIHHNSVNPSPWSSLSMHPLEAFLYHAVALWHLVIPSNPIVAMFQLHMAGFGAINGHFGFDRFELPGDKSMQTHAYLHYLHHKHFEVNFGGDGLVPLDQWLGSWHDGSKDGDRRMQARYEKKLERLNGRKE